MQNKQDSLELHQVYKEYEQGGKVLEVLCGVDGKFQQGSSYAITGVSGSGKSTLMHVLGGLDAPTSGTVSFNGKDLTHFKASHKNSFLNKTIGFVFQFHYLVKELSVLENIMMMGLIRGETQTFCQHRAEHLLGMVGLASKAAAYPSHLSGGELQRVSIARALFNKPSFLLADEPTGSLDAENAQQVINLLFSAQQEWGMGIVLCSHDSVIYKRMSTVFRLSQGRLELE